MNATSLRYVILISNGLLAFNVHIVNISVNLTASSLGPRPSHPLLRRKIGKTRRGGGSGQVGTEKFVVRGISEA